MTVEELKEALSYYNDNAEVEVYIKSSDTHYNSHLYDMWIEGNKDETDEYFDRKRNNESDVVYFCLYR